METFDMVAIVALYATGGYLARSFGGEWWVYGAPHRLGVQRQAHPDLPTALAVAGVLVPSGRDNLANVTRYVLARAPETSTER